MEATLAQYFFPFLGGVILGLLSLLNLLKAIIKKKVIMEKVESLKSKINWRSIILTLIILFAYPFFLGFIGFVPITFLFFAILLRLIEPQKWSIVLGGASLAAIISYFVFQYWLKIQFPTGIFGI